MQILAIYRIPKMQITNMIHVLTRWNDYFLEVM
jgi:hypothetical protein